MKLNEWMHSRHIAEAFRRLIERTEAGNAWAPLEGLMTQGKATVEIVYDKDASIEMCLSWSLPKIEPAFSVETVEEEAKPRGTTKRKSSK